MNYNKIAICVLIVVIIISLFIENKREHMTVSNDRIKAVCVLRNGPIDGVIRLEELSNQKTKIYGQIKGFQPSSIHAIHIHEAGDLTDGCESACAHYNPFNKKHGGPNDTERHVGDLGNITADASGIIQFEMVDSLIQLHGPYSVIGRSFIIYQDPDDLGIGGHLDSLTTGHGGKRLVCGVIGYAKGC